MCVIIMYLIIKYEIIIKNLRQFIFMIYKVMNKQENPLDMQVSDR